MNQPQNAHKRLSGHALRCANRKPDHLKSDLQKVRILNVFRFQMVGFQTPFVFKFLQAKVKDPFYLSCPRYQLSFPLFKLPDISISAASDDVIPIHGVLNQGVPIRVGIPHFAQTHFWALLASRLCSNLNMQKTFGFKNELK